MHCNVAVRQIQLYIDGRLSINRLSELEAHISICPTCRVELEMLEEVSALCKSRFQFVQEPEDLAMQIMQRIARNPAQDVEPAFSLLRPSLAETIAIIFLATVASLGLVLSQPFVRARLPIANGHDSFSQVFIPISHWLFAANIDILTWGAWIIGTFLGVCITLILVGSDIRTEWFNAIRYPSILERVVAGKSGE